MLFTRFDWKKKNTHTYIYCRKEGKKKFLGSITFDDGSYRDVHRLREEIAQFDEGVEARLFRRISTFFLGKLKRQLVYIALYNKAECSTLELDTWYHTKDIEISDRIFLAILAPVIFSGAFGNLFKHDGRAHIKTFSQQFIDPEGDAT